MQEKRLAIIDLGTNTFHLMIARIDEREDFSIEEKFKESVKLGEGGINKGEISEKAFQRGIKALKKFRKLIHTKRADEVRAFATSAIRSASNGAEFVQAAKRDAGIDIRVINGNEEASLIYDGVRNGVQLPYEQDTLIIDIGGGSVEFIVSRDGKPQLLRSLPLGAARLLEAVVPDDPISTYQLDNAYALVRKILEPLVHELREFDLKLMVGSSGSFETLGAMIALRNEDVLSSGRLNSYRFSVEAFQDIFGRIVSANRDERLAMSGMEAMRVDMIVMAGIIIDSLVHELEIAELMVSAYALKEGILFRYIEEQKERIHKLLGNTARNVRAKAVKNLAEKYNYYEGHSLKVSEHGSSLYNQLAHLHPFGKAEEEVLRYGCLLHDIGHFINRSGHHKHGQYIIMHSGLSGFSHDELVVLGNIVRYHRKSLPTRDHFHYKILDQRSRYLVRLLAGILRIADNFDRGGRGRINGFKVHTDQLTIRIEVQAEVAVDIEIQCALDQKTLLEQVLDREILITQAGN